VALASAGATKPPDMLLPGVLIIRYKHSGLGFRVPNRRRNDLRQNNRPIRFSLSQIAVLRIAVIRGENGLWLQQLPRSFVIPAPGSYPDGSFSGSS
jgi:hypothetical protein